MEKKKIKTVNIIPNYIKCRNCYGEGWLSSSEGTYTCKACEGTGKFLNGYEMVITNEDGQKYGFFVDTIK